MHYAFTLIHSAASVFVFFIMLLPVYSCKEHRQPVARAFDRYLYQEDLNGVVPPGITGKDSLQLVKTYIEQWQHKQVLLNKAEKHLTADNPELNRRLEEYKNGLIIYEYEQALIGEKLDTLVKDAEVQEYYNKRNEIFVLKQPIVKVSYIKLGIDTPEPEMVKRWFLSANSKDLDLLEQYCNQYSPLYSLRDTSWYYPEELSKKIPFERVDEDNYRNFNRIFEFTENNELYLIILHDSKFRDSRSPLALERDKIRKLILNKRKMILLDQMEEEAFHEALRKDNTEIYSQ